MSSIATALERNRAFAEHAGHDGVPLLPRLSAFVVTCLDPRVDPAGFLGLTPGDAFVVRNAGGRVTPEVIRDIQFIASIADLVRPGDDVAFEVAIVHHTQCGTALLGDEQFRRNFADRAGVAPEPLADLAVTDAGETVDQDVARLVAALRAYPRIPVSGFVYDLATGRVTARPA